MSPTTTSFYTFIISAVVCRLFDFEKKFFCITQNFCINFVIYSFFRYWSPFFKIIFQLSDNQVKKKDPGEYKDPTSSIGTR